MSGQVGGASSCHCYRFAWSWENLYQPTTVLDPVWLLHGDTLLIYQCMDAEFLWGSGHLGTPSLSIRVKAFHFTTKERQGHWEPQWIPPMSLLSIRHGLYINLLTSIDCLRPMRRKGGYSPIVYSWELLPPCGCSCFSCFLNQFLGNWAMQPNVPGYN